MDRSEGNDDELYPSAPVPPHERVWRHPSEMGEQAWHASEPPLAIGRGLSAATGVIGGMLALAVLWTMLPTHAGRSAGVTVRSTVASSAGFGSSSSISTLATPSTTDSSTATSGSDSPTSTEPGTTGSSGPTTSPSPSSTPPTAPAPLPTYAVAAAARPEQTAVAVAFGDGDLIVTTAAAVQADNTVELQLPDGSTEQATVLLVDQRSGFAVLAHDTAEPIASFTVATAMEPGDELTFYGTEGATAVVQDDGSLVTTGTDPAAPVEGLPEGTPVVNQRGELVALCSHAGGEATLVALTELDALRKALDVGGPGKVWMGVVLDSADGSLRISAVENKGPAAVAGLMDDDVLVSIDGVEVLDSTAVGATLAAHAPGDVVTVVVDRAGIQLTFSVTLAAPRASL